MGVGLARHKVVRVEQLLPTHTPGALGRPSVAVAAAASACGDGFARRAARGARVCRPRGQRARNKRDAGTPKRCQAALRTRMGMMLMMKAMAMIVMVVASGLLLFLLRF